MAKKAGLKRVGLTVLNDRVLIDPDPVEYQGASEKVLEALRSQKIVLPDAYEAFYKNLPETGVVVAIGNECKMPIAIGNRVHFAKMSAAKMKFKGKDYLVVREYDVDLVYED